MGRYERAAKAAGARGRWDRVEHYVSLLDRDTALYNAAAYPPVPADPAPASPPPSQAAAYTWETTVDMTEDDLAAAYAERAGADDEAALRAIEAVWDQREQLAAERDAELAEYQAEKARPARAAWESWQASPESADESPVTNPTARPSRRRSPDQECREEYDTYLYTQYLEAEEDCRGAMLSREGKAKGIDPQTLFSGQNSVAAKYASAELKQWWSTHGRLTYAEWKFSWFGRCSDRDAARTAQMQSFGEYVA